MEEKFTPVYLRNELGDIWDIGKTREAEEHNMELCRQLSTYWTSLSNKLWDYYNPKKNPIHYHYVHYLMHDGNRTNSTAISYIKGFEKGEYINPWYVLQNLMRFIWQAEVFFMLVNKA